MTQSAKAPQRLVVAAICGSLRPGSYTKMALQVALQGAREVGAETRLIDLRDYQLPFCDGNDDESALSPDVFRLRREVAEAGGILLGTPEYHGSYSGVLKNTLDLMGFGEFEGKMIGLVGVSGGALGAFDALNNLRSVGRALHAWVIPEQAAIASAYRMFDDDGSIKDAGLEKRLKEVGRRVARFAFLHNSEQALDFLRAWEGAPDNPGGAKG
jgi:NAD(P)H-dependent FMN reductase